MGRERCSSYMSKPLSLKKPEPPALLPAFLVCPPPPWGRKQSPHRRNKVDPLAPKLPGADLTSPDPPDPSPPCLLHSQAPALARVLGARSAGLCTLRPCCCPCSQAVPPVRTARGRHVSQLLQRVSPVPRAGIKPASPTLQGRFLTTGPPGKFPCLPDLSPHLLPTFGGLNVTSSWRFPLDVIFEIATLARYYVALLGFIFLGCT